MLRWDDHPFTLHYDMTDVEFPLSLVTTQEHYTMIYITLPPLCGMITHLHYTMRTDMLGPHVWGDHPSQYTMICIMLSHLCGVITHPITL